MEKNNNTIINIKILQSILSDFVHDFSSISTGVTVGLDLLKTPMSKEEYDESYNILLKSSKKLKSFIDFYRSAYNLDTDHIEKSSKKYFSCLDINLIWNKFISSNDYNIILVFLLIWLSKKVKKYSNIHISKNRIEIQNANISKFELDILDKNSSYYFLKYNHNKIQSPILEVALTHAKNTKYNIEINQKKMELDSSDSYVITIN